MGELSVILPIILIAGLVFLICREFVCWYLKVNRAVDLLEEIAKNTRKEDSTLIIKQDNDNIAC